MEDDDEESRCTCPVCNCTVAQDEFFDCPTCEKRMCLYCWQELSCPEHGIPYGDPYWQEHDYWSVS
jgi:hypothetical protein